MAETKYEKYIIREPLAEGLFTPRLLFDSKNYFPEIDFGIRYTYIKQPVELERPHAHDFDQFLCFMGSPEDMRVFDGEVELYLGEESTRNIINSTSVVYIPSGMVHCPIIWTRVDKPMMFVNIVLTSSYTRSDQRAGFRDSLELTAQKVTSEEASRVLGTPVPRPAYLPEGCKVQEIYVQDDSVRLLISEAEIEKQKRTLGYAVDTPERYHFECRMDMAIKWHPEGKVGGLKTPGESVTINADNDGILADREQHVELSWLLPPKSTPKQPGQYEILLSAGKRTSKDELLKVAKSVTL